MTGDPIRIAPGRGFETLLDAEDAHFAQVRWFVTETSAGKRYAMRTEKRAGKQRTVYLHRLILAAPPGVFVDHINGDSLDNRRSNLRLATPAQNTFNRRSQSASGFRGVYRNHNRWVTSIEVGGKKIRGGSFSDKVLAARRYDELAALHFGEFAALNFARGQE